MLKNSNTHDPRPAVGYFLTKHDNLIIYMGMNLIINSINKGSEMLPMDKMTVTVNNKLSLTQQLIHTIINNKNLLHKEHSQF